MNELILVIVVSIVSILVNLIMIFAYIVTRNAVIDIVTSFETQNSNSYEIRINVFNRAISFLFNLETKIKSEEAKCKELGEIFDNLLICATRQDTLSIFEKVMEVYFEQGVLDEKLFNKFKGCVRREFGCKKYHSKIVCQHAIPTGKITIQNYADKDNKASGENAAKASLQQKLNNIGVKNSTPTTPSNTAPTTGVTIVTGKTQPETTMPNIILPKIDPNKNNDDNEE